MRVALLTREYPPEVYGGAGVHVEYLARELARLADVTVHCWGADRAGDGAAGRRAPAVGRARRRRRPHLAALQAMSIDLTMAAASRAPTRPQPHLVRELRRPPRQARCYGIPHVATVHSLEPLRPWKAEQLGGGYALSSFCERTALEARRRDRSPSRDGMRARPPRVLPGDRPGPRRGHPQRDRRRASTRPTAAPTCSSATASTRTRRRVVFVGRITRQKGVAAPARGGARRSIPRRSSSSAPARRTRPRSPPRSTRRVERLRAERGNVIWLEEMLPKPEVIQLLSHATVFVCPSIYEPLGIVNLEAMACEAAVVATATGRHPRGRRRRRHRACSCRSSPATTARASRVDPAALRRTGSPSA